MATRADLQSRSNPAYRKPSFSVVTVTLNCAEVIERTLLSVRQQSHGNVEHIIVDGGSTDGTQALVQKYQSSQLRFISEPDNGIYDAMNKGLHLASNEIVCFLNAGDMYSGSTVMRTVAEIFIRESPDIVFGNLVYFDDQNPNRAVRTYDAASFHRGKLRRGIIPPHMATFVKRSLLLEVDGFDEDYLIAGDFDCMVKLFWKRDAKFSHVPEVLVWMQQGGISNASLKNRWLTAKEIRHACRKHGVPTGWLRLFSRYPGKIWESLRHRL